MSKRRLPNTNSPEEVRRAFQVIYDELEAVDNADGRYKVWFVFDDTTERDAFFTTYPDLLETDLLVAIKDTSPPPTPGVRSLNFSKAYNSQYFILGIP